MPVKPVDKIWMNGTLVNWADAKIHILSHVIHYGSSWFEGIRCYNTKKGPAIFRLDKHLERLYDSVKIHHAQIPYDKKELEDAVIQTIIVNKMKSCYIRPIVYRGYGDVGVNPLNNPVDVAIAVWEWGTYLGADALTKGIDVCVSSWTRPAPTWRRPTRRSTTRSRSRAGSSPISRATTQRKASRRISRSVSRSSRVGKAAR